MASSSQGPRPGSEAQRLFAEHVVRSEGPVEVEGLCRAHPELAEELRELHRRWTGAVHGASLLDRLRQRHGDDLALDVTLEPTAEEPEAQGGARPESAAAGPSSSVYGRLAARSPESGRYRLEGEIARGGMGAILRVWDEDLRRTLAMKVALTRAGAGEAGSETAASDSRLLGRFLEEAQVTGQLDHPGIVPVHELGLDSQGRVFFTMRLVKGRDLEQVFELVQRGEQGWTRTRALGVLLKVCEAMAFAHEKGVVHRDLKPANVMVGRFGETYVMDWGLARVLGREDSHDVRLRSPGTPRAPSMVRTDRADDRDAASPLVTMDGDVVGTPCYMPPEQARGRLEDIGPRSDVYAAGAMLYHLLTGRMPYAGAGESPTPREVLRRLMEGPPEPVQAIDRGVPDELVAICEKAMAREPAARYATMLEMAEDLRAYLEDRVVQAHATGPVAEFRKWIRRNRATAVAGALAAAATVAGLVTIVLVQARANEDLLAAKEQTEDARDEAVAAQLELQDANADLELARDEADRRAREARLAEYAASIAAASSGLRLADAGEARRRLASCSEDLRGWEWRQLTLAADPSVRDLGPTPRQVASVAWHPEGELVATLSPEGVVRVLRAADGDEVGRLEAPEALPHALAFTPDGARLALVHRDRAVHLWDVARGVELRRFGLHSGAITDLALAPDGTRAATASSDKLVRVWDVATGELLHTLEGHRSGATAVAFGRGGRLLASGSRDRSVRLWDVESGAALAVLEGSEFGIAFVAFDPAGVHVAAGSVSPSGMTETVSRGANTVRLWDVDTGALVGLFAGPRGALNAGSVSPDGRWLLAASEDSTVWLWDLRTGRDQVLLGHAGALLDAAFSPDGTHVVTSSEDGTVKLWNPELRLGFTLRGHAGALSAAAFAARGELLVTASADGTLRTWSTRSGLVEAVWRGHLGTLIDLDLTPGGDLAASASSDGTVRLWEVASGSELAVVGEASVPGPGGLALARGPRVGLSPDGRRMAIAGPGGSVELWDVERREPARSWSATEGLPGAVRWSPDGKRFAVLRLRQDYSASTLELFEPDRDVPLRRRVVDGRVGAIAWSADGTRLAAGRERTVDLLDPLTLEVTRELVGHEGLVSAIAFTPDGRRLATSARDDAVRIWELSSGDTLLALPPPGAEVADLEFGPDGDQLAAACSDWSAFVWSTAPTAGREEERELARARRRELLPLLDQLFEAFPDPEAVVQRLRADPGLEAGRLRTALRLARLAAPDARSAERESWRVLRLPGASEEELHVALWSARAAVALEPDDESSQLLLGAALHRLDRHAEALGPLERADALRRARGRVEVLAFLAMARHHLGDAEGAQRAFAELAALMQVPALLVQRENQALLLEAETVLRQPR